MPRQLRYIAKAEVSTRRLPHRTHRTYGGTYTELVRYLADKYGVRMPSVRAMLDDAFRYVEMEALGGERGIFTVPRFGRFERREIQHGEYSGGSHSSTVLRFTRAAVRRGGTYIDFDDEEWVGPDE